MSNPINLTGVGQKEPYQPARDGGRSDSDSDADSDHGGPVFFLHISNDPDPAAGATSQWRRLKWAAPTKGKSSPNWKSFLVGAEDGMSLMYLLKKGKQARQLEAEVGVGAYHGGETPCGWHRGANNEKKTTEESTKYYRSRSRSRLI